MVSKLLQLELELSCEKSLDVALGKWYRLIDTVNAYFNEQQLKSSFSRRDIFLSTKLWPSVYESTTGIDETLDRIQLDYIDLLFLHQPAGNYADG